MVPSNKVGGGALAGAVTIVLVWVMELSDLKVPNYVAQSLTVIISFATGYFVPDKQ